jgi:hypothetical protein
MASPHVITPFHVDHTASLLLQISGNEKRITVFPSDDRHLVTQEEVESFYAFDLNSVGYKPQLKSRGIEYDLLPGIAVNIPPLSPHTVKNGNDISISASFSLCFPELEFRARVHQVNYHLRKLGFRPPEPGIGRFDQAKSKALQALSKRNPKTYHELVFSGLDRLRLPIRIANKLGRIPPRRQSAEESRNAKHGAG